MLRSVFAELTRSADTRPLFLSPLLARHSVCVPMPLPREADECLRRDEWFMRGTEPAAGAPTVAAGPIRFSRPTPGLQLAYDPRLPADAQQFEFALQGVDSTDRVVWEVDGREANVAAATYRWPVAKGDHRVAATVWRGEALLADLRPVEFIVK